MDVRYPKTFLQEVVVRTDFAVPIRALTEDIPPALNRAIQSNFSLAEPPQEVNLREVRVAMGKDTSQARERRQVSTLRKYSSATRNKHLHLHQDYCFVSYSVYESFAQLRADFLPVIDKIFELGDDIQLKRLGLRYINHIELKEPHPTDWERYLNRDLLSIFDIHDRKQIARAFHQLFLNLGDFLVNFQYGMHNPDFPDVIRRKVFILDYDAYYDGFVDDNREVHDKLDKFHGVIERLFWNSVQPALKEKMRGGESVDD